MKILYLIGIVSSTKLFKRVIGGSRVLTPYPFMALIEGKPNCGASLIQKPSTSEPDLPYLFLTAAHCLSDFNVDKLQTSDLTIKMNLVSKTDDSCVEFTVVDYRVPSHTGRDYAVLSGKIRSNEHEIENLEIIRLSETYYSNELTIAGWGSRTTIPFRYSKHLYSTKLNISSIWDNEILTDSNQKRFNHVGYGDSGSPLFFKNSKNQWIQVGILSGVVKIKLHLSALFTSVSSVRYEIKEMKTELNNEYINTNENK